MQNYWFTSDQHFYHKNILRFTDRPYETVEDMNEAFIEWNNANVGEKDVVWNLGDFSFGDIEQTKSVLRRLKGQQNLILGNHCHNLFNHRNELLNERLFMSIQHYRELRFDKTRLVLSHYPMRSWSGSNRGSIQLFGHVHGHLAPYGKSVDVGVDSEWITGGYAGRAFHLDEILEYMKDRQIENDY